MNKSLCPILLMLVINLVGCNVFSPGEQPQVSDEDFEVTRESCQRFNRRTRDFEEHNGVLYQTIAGVQPLYRIFWPLRYSYRIVWREEGENDGLVSVKSATWRDEYLLEVLDADHFDQIGWWDGSKRSWIGS